MDEANAAIAQSLVEPDVNGQSEPTENHHVSRSSSFAILGAGNSTGVPWLQCVINPAVQCKICKNCLDDPHSKNIRNNPCAIIRYAHPDGRTRNILIDCGKTFRDCVMKSFQKFGVQTIDAILITHAHADAYLGLDDVRDVSPRTTMPIYVTQETYDAAKRVFPYLMAPPTDPGLFVAQLDWRIIKPYDPFTIDGMTITPLPVDHGEGYTCIGYEFGATDSRVIYISDVSEIPEKTMEFIMSKPTHLLVLDALSYNPYPTHFTVPTAISCAKRISARYTRFVGMNHNMDYYQETKKLKKMIKEEGLNHMRYAYDGWHTDLSI